VGNGEPSTNKNCNLSVNGDISWSTSMLRNDKGGAIELRGVGNAPYIDFTTSSLTADYDARILLGGDKKLNFYSNVGTGAGYVFNDAPVGIGTATIPSGYKLAIGGAIIAEKVSVKLQALWPVPDYVFGKSYKLPLLSDVESYVKANRHLPEVPSEKEITNDGLDLAQMNIILLKKVEELTLYLIEQNKKLEQQAKDIELLKKK
jgi:hypothetical protein